MDFRPALRKVVKDNPEIDIIIVHQSNGDNDFFSHKPEVEACERERVIAACEAVIKGIRETEAREVARSGGKPQSCPGRVKYTTVKDQPRYTVIKAAGCPGDV